MEVTKFCLTLTSTQKMVNMYFDDLCGSCKKPSRTSSQFSYLYNYKVEKSIQSGRLAQSGERQDGIQEISGSSPGLAGYFSHLVIFVS